MVGGSAKVGAAGGWVMGAGHGPMHTVLVRHLIYFRHTYAKSHRSSF